MNLFEMVVAIVAVVTIGRVVQARYGAGRRCNPGPLRSDDGLTAENQRLRQELDSLRDRIQVLERVITDNHSASDLDREIERLRNK